jgi:heme-degrading monooxygenase HmoA
MSAHPQELVIIDIWTVAPGRQQEEMADALRASVERLRLIDGFIEGDVLANWDETRVASFLRFRSAADWERVTEDDEFVEQMRTLESIGSSEGDAYERMAVIAPPKEHGPIDVSYGTF